MPPIGREFRFNVEIDEDRGDEYQLLEGITSSMAILGIQAKGRHRRQHKRRPWSQLVARQANGSNLETARAIYGGPEREGSAGLVQAWLEIGADLYDRSLYTQAISREEGTERLIALEEPVLRARGITEMEVILLQDGREYCPEDLPFDERLRVLRDVRDTLREIARAEELATNP